MSSEALKEAKHAEWDLNSYQAKQGVGRKSDSTLESGVDEMVEKRFPEHQGVRTGPEVDTRGSNRQPIPEDEGGSRDDRGRLAPAGAFEGEGGPEEKVKMDSERRPGDDDTLNLQDMKREGLEKR